MFTNKKVAILSGALAIAISDTHAVSLADPVQITLFSNSLSSSGGNLLNADLTGDGVDDISIQSVSVGGSSASAQINSQGLLSRVKQGPDRVVSTSFGSFTVPTTLFTVDPVFASSGVGEIGAVDSSIPGGYVYLNLISFSDSRINGGQVTEGWLEVRGYANGTFSAPTAGIVFERLIFNQSGTTRPDFDAIPAIQPEWIAPVPEPSALALLALGAVGFLRRRRA